MINSVSLTGRLTRAVELRYTQSGTAVGTFTLAVDRQFTNANGDRDTDFINCVIWRKSAENLSNFTRKGSMLGVMGHLQVRNYENNQGQRVYVTEVVVENFALLESRAVTEARPQEPAGDNQNNGFQNNFGQGQAPRQNNFGGNQNNNGFNQGFSGNNQNAQSNPSSNNAGNAGSQPNFGANNSNDNNASDPFDNGGKPVDISDDDLPF